MLEKGLGGGALYRTFTGREFYSHHEKDYESATKVCDSEYDGYKPYHSSTHGIHYYARYRWCEECGETFWTAELAIDHVYELIKLRKENAELRERVQCLENSKAKLQEALDNFVGVAKNTFANTVKFTELQARRREVVEQLYQDYNLEVRDVHEESNSEKLVNIFVHNLGNDSLVYNFGYNFGSYSPPYKTELLEQFVEASDIPQKAQDLVKLVIEYRRLDKEIKELVDR